MYQNVCFFKKEDTHTHTHTHTNTQTHTHKQKAEETKEEKRMSVENLKGCDDIVCKSADIVCKSAVYFKLT